MLGEYIDIDAPYSFIGGGVMEPEIVDGLWDFWDDPVVNTYLEKTEGHCGGQGDKVNKTIKESIDMTVPRYFKDKRITNYIDGLAEVTREYVNYWPMLRTIHWDLQSDFNLQWYPKGGGFKQMHCERNNADIEAVTRVMAWMTYLNDIEEGGETLFDVQQAKVKPKKGLTLIWPSDWTHFHQGIPAPNEEKMIITGWYNLVR
tara:strand:- start:1419 stop:2024 length:606 start_codon:yes stop_codon:yes gene_type:complete